VRAHFTVTAFALILFAALLSACGGGTAPASDPGGSSPAIPPIMDQLPSLDELPPTVVVRSVSEAFQQEGWQGEGNALGTAVQDGTSISLPSGEHQMAGGIYGYTVTYPTLAVPYIAPYEITINTDGGGDFWVALADYGRMTWNILPETFSGTAVNMPIGLEPNASNSDGYFIYAILTYGGENVTVSSIDLVYPDLFVLGEPVEYQQFIEADDGTRLATSIFLPYEESELLIPDPPYPAVLFRTPYDKAETFSIQYEGFNLPTALASLNVVMVVQYFRGRKDDSGAWPDSEGTETLFREHNGPDHTDAIDTMDWIEARHWYNGTTVLSGPSALGLWIYQATPGLGDRIAGIYPQVSSGNVANWAAQRNGCFKRSNVEGWLTGNNYPPELLTEAEDNYGSDAYWDALDFDAQASSAACPGYHEVGWWDVDVESTIYSWQQLQSNGGAGAAGNQWLVIGPGGHDSMRSETVGELTFPTTPLENDPRAVPDAWDGLKWALKPLGRNPLFFEPTAHVLAYFIGSDEPAFQTTEPNNHWYEMDAWPPSASDWVLYLSSDTPSLTDTNPVAETTAGWQCVPANPVLTKGGANLPGGPMLAGPYDQSEPEVHEDVLQLRTGGLAEAVSVAGPIPVHLFVSTDAVDTDIMVKLIDEYPDGRNMLVTDSAVRLSWYLAENELGDVVPGTVYEVQFNLGDRAYVFESGHMIGLDIQSTNYPRYDINPGNGDPFFTGLNGTVQGSTLYMGGATNSHVTLPEFDPSA